MRAAPDRGRRCIPALPVAEGRFFRFRPRRRRAPRLSAIAGLVLLVTPAAAALLAGCGDASARAARGPVVRRVVSLVPSATELVLALDRADRLVARTAYERDPRIAHIPSLGRTTTPSAEAIVAHDPDLVLLMSIPGARPLARTLEDLGVRVRTVEARRLHDVPRVARHLGALLGADARADSLATVFERTVADVRRRYDAAERPSVFYLLWHDPPRTAGAATFIGDLIRTAGGRNAFPDASEPWPRVGLEALVARDPDCLVVPTGTLPDDPVRWLRTAPGWRELTAVRRGRVVVVDGELFSRPGPRLAEAAERLGRALHGRSGTGAAAGGTGCAP